ncbi:hypothetical protein AB9F45_38275, partial [Rhizobium leguminosarum]
IASCGGSYCVTLKTVKYAGRKIGTLSGTGGSYAGEITDPAAEKTYSGSGKISGNSFRMRSPPYRRRPSSSCRRSAPRHAR